MKRLIELFKKYKEVILYLIVGGLTTVINVVVYWIFAHPLSLNTTVSTAIAWLASVIFAFFANKLVVFESKSFEAEIFIKEFLSFFLSRLATGVLDVGIMYLSVDILHASDLIMKIVSNVIVIILNYVISKFFVFGKKK